MFNPHKPGDDATGLERALAAVIREASRVGATVTVTVNPLPPDLDLPMASSGADQAEVLDPPEVEAALVLALCDAPGEQLTLVQFAEIEGRTVEETRGLLRGAGRTSISVKDWLYTRFDTKTDDGRKIRTYRLTDAGRKAALDWEWVTDTVDTTAIDKG